MTTTRAHRVSGAARPDVVRVALDFSADTLTPVLAFLRLARAGRRAFLLESVEGGERLGRHSFLGVDPIAVVRIRDGVASVERADSVETLAGNPFHAVGDYLDRFRAAPVPGLPPFQGGAIGYLGYECASFLERIPLAPASADDRADQACIMVFRDIVAFDHVRRRVFVIANVFRHEEPESRGLAEARRRIESLRDALHARSPDEHPLSLSNHVDVDARIAGFQAAMGRARYVAAARTIKSHIRAGDIFQCVLSDQFRFPGSAPPFSIYRALGAINPSPYLFYLSFGDDVLLGASPEMLVRSAGGKVETCPIAGTRPRGATEALDQKLERDLLKSVKERAEHLMLVDLGRNDLGRVSRPGTVRVPSFMQVQRFSHVMHLVSNVEGRLGRGRRPWDALGSCFPAGTLSGAPKVRAMEIIAGLEPVRRHAYGGAVIYHDFAGHLDSCITIRSLFLRNGVGYAQAGAGVVADSNPESEYDEVLHKLRAVARAVATAEAAESVRP